LARARYTRRMKTVTGSVVLPCSPERFWQVFLDETYTRAVFMDALQFKDFGVLELDETSRKIRAVPRLKVPGVIEKLIGDSFAYEEHGTLDRARGLWTWRMVPPSNLDPTKKPKKEIVTTRGTVRVEPAGDGKCRRSDEVVVEAKIFGIGGLIESTVEKELRASWAKEFAFLTRWLEERVKA
jgi:hypothetical protein